MRMRIWSFSPRNWKCCEHLVAVSKLSLANPTQSADYSCRLVVRGLQRQQKLGDIECSPWFAQTADIRRPFAPLFCVVSKRALHLRDHVSRRICDHARIRLDDQPGIAFLLTGNDVVDDHRTAGGDCFLHPGPSSFSDQQMTGL